MEQLNIENATGYLKRRGIGISEPAIFELGGGVSNTVLLVESDTHRFVLKQALGKLRVQQEWLADQSRIFRESAALRKLNPYFPEGSLPAVLFEDRDNFTFAMSAAPCGSVCWKDLLLKGEIHIETAERVGELLALMASVSWRAPGWAAEFGDQTIFGQLRIDPYYRATARKRPGLS